jgi:hypothetical protein
MRLDLQTCLNNIFSEEEFRGIYPFSDVWNVFESSWDREKIETLIKEFDHTYRKIWESIGFMDVTETFGEVSKQPFSDHDLEGLDTGLRELEEMNRGFLGIALPKAEVLIRNELARTAYKAE